MELTEYLTLFRSESSHFYYVANHRMIIDLINRYLPYKNSRLRILDAGCGSGLLIKKLSRFGTVSGVDIHPEAIKLAKKRGVKVVQASVEKLPFKNNTFDLAICIDVLYHLQVVDDQKAIQELFRVVKPGGILILRVPAYQWLKKSYDRSVHTRHRYYLKELADKLEKSRFKILKISYINLLLLPFAMIAYLTEKILGHKTNSTPLIKLPSYLNHLLISILSLENFMLRYTDIPFGLGIVTVCKK